MIVTLRRMIRSAGTQSSFVKNSVLLVILSAILQGIIFALLFPIFRILLSENQEGLFLYVGVMIALIIVDAIIRYIVNHRDYIAQLGVSREVRVNLGRKLHRMPLEYLGSRQSGDLNVVLSGDVNDLVMIMGSLYAIAIYTIVTPMTTVAIIFFFDWRVALGLAILFPLAVPVYQRIRQLASKENKLVSRAHAQVSGDLVEYAQGIQVLRATRQVGDQSIKMQSSLQELRDRQRKATNWSVVPRIVISFIFQIGILLVLALGTFWVANEVITLVVLFATIAVMIRFAENLSMFATLATMFDFMEAALERIDVMLDVKPLPVIDEFNDDMTSFDIEFEQVDFAYYAQDMDNEDALTNVSFKLKERSLTALVGPSGSGKTTITKLISRYAFPQNGTIKIGGVDIQSMTEERLMSFISVVFQDVYLFDDTIRNNIRMSNPDATDEEVEQAAKAANCHEFVSRLPDGYDTTVGEIGGSLSGGERQRISIARAILKDAPIVLLDEPSSALDTESEVAVQKAINTLIKNKTVLVIAHRLSTVVAANQIVVLEKGEIVEKGTHDELIAHDGLYKRMWDAQTKSKRWKVTSVVPA